MICSIWGYFPVAHFANPYSPANTSRPLRNEKNRLNVAAPINSARKKSRRSTPHTVSGRWRALWTARHVGRFVTRNPLERLNSEQTCQELTGEQRESAAEDDS